MVLMRCQMMTTQWLDMDGDGFGDNPAPASNPDSCPSVAGKLHTRWINRWNNHCERFGCLDSDGDSYDDLSDDFPIRCYRMV